MERGTAARAAGNIISTETSLYHSGQIVIKDDRQTGLCVAPMDALIEH